MKKTLLFCMSLMLFCCKSQLSESVFPQREKNQKRETASYDYKTKASGQYSDSSIWMKLVGATWVDAHNVPDINNNVFLEAGFTVQVDSLSSCKDLNINATADVVRIDTDTNSLNVYGRLRTYSGSAPGTSTILAGVSDYIQGTLVFKGSSDQTIIASGQFSADANNKGWNMVIDYSAVATIDQDTRCSNVIIENGTLKVNPTKSLRPAGAGATIDGSITVKSGSTLVAGLLFKSGSSPMQSFVLESGATLDFNNTSSPVLAAQTLSLNGLVVLSGSTANFPTTGSRSGSSVVGTFYDLTVKDSGAKKLQNNVSVTNVYSLVSPATVNLNGFALTNP